MQRLFFGMTNWREQLGIREKSVRGETSRSINSELRLCATRSSPSRWIYSGRLRVWRACDWKPPEKAAPTRDCSFFCEVRRHNTVGCRTSGADPPQHCVCKLCWCWVQGNSRREFRVFENDTDRCRYYGNVEETRLYERQTKAFTMARKYAHVARRVKVADAADVLRNYMDAACQRASSFHPPPLIGASANIQRYTIADQTRRVRRG